MTKELETVEDITARIFRKWQLTQEQQAVLLPAESEGRLAIMQDIMSIHKALRYLYPHNEELLYGWIHLKNYDLQERKPLDIMLEGSEGIQQIHHFLNACLQR